MTPRRHSNVTRIFHWLMALVIAMAWSLGYYATTIDMKADKAYAFTTIFTHKNFGITVLLLVVLRFAWRVAQPPPPLPETMHPLLRRGAIGGHYLLYLLMLLVPLSGIAKSAAEGYGIPVYGLFTIPPIFAKGSPAALLLGGVHDWLVWVFLVVILGHIAMALKHRFIDRDDVFASMAIGHSTGSQPDIVADAAPSP